MKNLVLILMVTSFLLSPSVVLAGSCRDAFSGVPTNTRLKTRKSVFVGDNSYRFLQVELTTLVEDQGRILEILVRNKPGMDPMFSANYLFSEHLPSSSRVAPLALEQPTLNLRADLNTENKILVLQAEKLVFQIDMTSPDELLLVPIMKNSGYRLPDFRLKLRPSP